MVTIVLVTVVFCAARGKSVQYYTVLYIILHKLHMMVIVIIITDNVSNI